MSPSAPWAGSSAPSGSPVAMGAHIPARLVCLLLDQEIPVSDNRSAAWMAPAPTHRAHGVCGHLGGLHMETPLQRNHLLALLPPADRQALGTQADIVSLQAYDELY